MDSRDAEIQTLQDRAAELSAGHCASCDEYAKENAKLLKRVNKLEEDGEYLDALLAAIKEILTPEVQFQCSDRAGEIMEATNG